MIHSILVTNPSGDSLPLVLMWPMSSGLIVRDIQGLGPAKSNVNIRGNTGISGSAFNSAMTPSRNIVFTLDFLESPTIEAARLRTYKYFPNMERIRLDITTDEGTSFIYGYVESNEPNIFSSSQGAVISIICPDPFFQKENGKVEGAIQSIANLFEFPFSNPVGNHDLIFGERFFQTIDFEIVSTASVVIEPTLILTAEGGAVSNPRIFFYSQDDPDVVKALKFAFTTPLPALQDGDHLLIVCEKQNKSVKRWKASTEEYINYLGAVTIDSNWPVLKPGTNYFSYEADSGGAYIRFAYEFMPKFIGV